MSLPELTDATFSTVTQSAGICLVDFWAPWCGHCIPMKAMLEELSPDGVRIYAVDVQEYPNVGAQFGIRSLPTIIFFRDGNPVKTMVGVTTKVAILEAIRNL